MTVNKRKNNNSGMTLVELLVVIALMALLIGMAVIGTSLITSGNKKKATNTVVTTLSELRTNTLSISADWKETIENDSGTYKVSIWKGSDEVTTSSLGTGLNIYFQDSSQTDKMLIAPGGQLTITYMIGSGKFNQVIYKDETGAQISQISSGSKSGQIIVSNSKGDSAITMWYDTGRMTQN